MTWTQDVMENQETQVLKHLILCGRRGEASVEGAKEMGCEGFILSRSALSRLDEGRRYHCVKGGWMEEPGKPLSAWFPW